MFGGLRPLWIDWLFGHVEKALGVRSCPDLQHDGIRSKSYRIVCSNAQSQESCNEDYDDHDTNDVEDVH